MARRPKPTHLKLLQGNPGEHLDRLNTDEPQPEPKIPAPPPHLKGVALEAWHHYAPMLARNRMISEVDGIGLAAICQAYARWAEAESYLERQGLVLIGASGIPFQNPYLGIANRALDQIRAFLIEFGMTPAARSRVRMAAVIPPGGSEQPDGKRAGFDF